jgi:predicted ATPase
MAINRVEIKDFLVFKGNFAVDFCPGVNVIIGGNATGKTTLFKAMYGNVKTIVFHRNLPVVAGKLVFEDGVNILGIDNVKIVLDVNDQLRAVYIPEKDILEHAKGLLTFIEQKQTGFSQIYKDVLVNAQDIPTQKQSETQQKIGEMIVDAIGGEVRWDKGEGSFYTLRTDGTRIPFANEASGYKKLGYLGLLVTSGQLGKGSVLLWDEPENSLNPELMPILVEILIELQRSGVQIFLATHSEILASYLDALRTESDNVMFYSLYKDDEQIKADKSEQFDLLTPNNLTNEQAKLYEKEVEMGLGDGNR